MLKTLMDLCALSGVSGHEDEVRDYLKLRALPCADSVRVDTMGNLIVFKRGRKHTEHKLLLSAHMDEVGLMIHHITDEGYLKFDTVGGIDRRVLLGKHVAIGDLKIPGIIGLKAYHLVSAEEEKRLQHLTDFYIDIGAKNRAQAVEQVKIGDVAVFQSECVEFGDSMLKAKAIDDRIGCAILLEILKDPLPLDCTFVFSVQEEVGTRGAFAAAFSIKPEIALVLEGTTAADLPSMEAHKKVCLPGHGPVIPFMDGGTVYDRALFELLRGIAEEKMIPWQTKHFISGGTDASAIQRTKEGVRVAGISAAVRYLHTPSSVVSIRDYSHICLLTRAFMEVMARGE